MFTGIVQGVARLERRVDEGDLHRLRLALPPGFDTGLAIGASVACDGTCLTVTARPGPDLADFDVMAPTLALTTLGGWREGEAVNVERSAAHGDEVGGHILSGHVDGTAVVLAVDARPNHRIVRLAPPQALLPYLFERGFVALDGASLTIARLDRAAGWFEVGLIPETLRATHFAGWQPGDRVNLEIDRSTQAMVDTVRRAVDEVLLEALADKLGPVVEQAVRQAMARR